MKQKTDLKTLILAAKEGKKFKAKIIRDTPTYTWNEQEIIIGEFSIDYVTADWEVEWIKEPLKIELSGCVQEELDTDLAYVKAYLTREYLGKRFKMTIEEIVEVKND